MKAHQTVIQKNILTDKLDSIIKHIYNVEVMKALKLDSSYRPIDVIDALEALVMCLVGKARVIEKHAKEIRSVSKSFKLPAVIVLNRYVKFQFSYVSCNRENVLWRDNNTCQYCGKTGNPEKLTLDHVIPRSRGGDNSWQNLVAACKKCNQKKGNKTPAEAHMHPLKIPKKPKNCVLRKLKEENISPVWKDYLWNFS